MTAPAAIQAVAGRADRIHSAGEVAAAIDRMARGIAAELAGSDPILLCVMNGGLILTGALAQRLDFPLRIDYLHASRYRSATTGGKIDFRVPPALDPRGRELLVIDDILDEGDTLAAVLRYCRERGAARVLTAVLADKQRPRSADAPKADFVGLRVPDRFVFGSGMDYKGYLRNARGIYAIAREDEEGGQEEEQ
ncbi:MAG: hypoxanthine-guanine phosphoribosyltransferase [Gammaproteobacteria bacterium]|nr:hypoxanthine-guanine phosphoribosyltransferase [Gammaproteobacteria bacterium]